MAGTSFRDRSIACLGALIGIGIAGLDLRLGGGQRRAPAAAGGAARRLRRAALRRAGKPARPALVDHRRQHHLGAGRHRRRASGAGQGHSPRRIAVAAAIAVMSLLRCLHPPGGAASLLGVLGGPAAASWSFGFALVPVALNSILLVILGLIFHRFSRHSYPHKAEGGDGDDPRHDGPAAAAPRRTHRGRHRCRAGRGRRAARHRARRPAPHRAPRRALGPRTHRAGAALRRHHVARRAVDPRRCAVERGACAAARA